MCLVPGSKEDNWTVMYKDAEFLCVFVICPEHNKRGAYAGLRPPADGLALAVQMQCETCGQPLLTLDPFRGTTRCRP